MKRFSNAKARVARPGRTKAHARPLALVPAKGGATRREIRPPKYRPAKRRWH